jgi:uncharacterized protein
MPLAVNLRHLEADDVDLEGELPAAELDLDLNDEVIKPVRPLSYKLHVQSLETSLLVQGSLRFILDCECVRCLKPFDFLIELTDWACHIPLEGEEAAPVVNDSVDLTPYIREDILLAFPQHPLCKPDCGGLPKKAVGKPRKAKKTAQPEVGSPAWAELNKLKF